MSFEIKPFEWSDDEPDEDGYLSIYASTPFGQYHVRKDGHDSSFRWGYCFDEYYDENDFDCESIEEGKRLAFEHWIARVSGALIEISP